MLEYIKRVPQNNIAVIFHDKCTYNVSYKELFDSIVSVADILKEQVMVSQAVGICMSRSVSFLTTICACLHLHIPFLVISPSLPDARKDFMIKESGISLLIIEYPSNIGKKASINIVKTGNSENGTLNLISDICYILYTSGSTGVPKGVLISRKNLDCFLNIVIKTLPLENFQSFLACSDFSFDISLLELLVPLMLGMTIHMTSDIYLRNPHAISSLLKSNSIDVVQLTPSLLRMLFLFQKKSLHFMSSIKLLLIGGEPFPEELKTELIETIPDVYNMYGPTEATIWCSCMKLNHDSEIGIGYPFKGTAFSIRDNNGKEMPNGEKGELWIEGKQVGLGYVNQQIGRKNFVQILNKRFYRTGDLCIKNSQENCIYLGRADHQIKYRGHRIELEEIEKAILSDSRIEQTIVKFQEEQIICFYVSNEYTMELENDIKQMLKERLPSYMLPSKYQRVQKINVKSNGKIDRNQLDLTI